MLVGRACSDEKDLAEASAALDALSPKLTAAGQALDKARAAKSAIESNLAENLGKRLAEVKAQLSASEVRTLGRIAKCCTIITIVQCAGWYGGGCRLRFGT